MNQRVLKGAPSNGSYKCVNGGWEKNQEMSNREGQEEDHAEGRVRRDRVGIGGGDHSTTPSMRNSGPLIEMRTAGFSRILKVTQDRKHTPLTKNSNRIKFIDNI